MERRISPLTTAATSGQWYPPLKYSIFTEFDREIPIPFWKGRTNAIFMKGSSMVWLIPKKL